MKLAEKVREITTEPHLYGMWLLHAQGFEQIKVTKRHQAFLENSAKRRPEASFRDNLPVAIVIYSAKLIKLLASITEIGLFVGFVLKLFSNVTLTTLRNSSVKPTIARESLHAVAFKRFFF